MLIEELDSTQGNGTGHPGPAGDIGAVEEILPQFLIRDQVGRLMIVFSQFADGSGVSLLRAFPFAIELKGLDHFVVPVLHHDTSPFEMGFGEA